jgi:hypothetical protein
MKKQNLQIEQVKPGKWAAVTEAGVVKRLFYSLEEVNEFLKNQEERKK